MSDTATLEAVTPVATPTAPRSCKPKTPLDIDPKLWLAVTEMVAQQHGDMAVLGEPYFDSRERVWCDVTKNGKFVDTVYMGDKPPTTFDTLLRKDFVVSPNDANPDTHSIGPTIPLPVPPPAAKPIVTTPVATPKAK